MLSAPRSKKNKPKPQETPENKPANAAPTAGASVQGSRPVPSRSRPGRCPQQSGNLRTARAQLCRGHGAGERGVVRLQPTGPAGTARPARYLQARSADMSPAVPQIPRPSVPSAEAPPGEAPAPGGRGAAPGAEVRRGCRRGCSTARQPRRALPEEEPRSPARGGRGLRRAASHIARPPLRLGRARGGSEPGPSGCSRPQRPAGPPLTAPAAPPPTLGPRLPQLWDS